LFFVSTDKHDRVRIRTSPCKHTSGKLDGPGGPGGPITDEPGGPRSPYTKTNKNCEDSCSKFDFFGHLKLKETKL